MRFPLFVATGLGFALVIMGCKGIGSGQVVSSNPSTEPTKPESLAVWLDAHPDIKAAIRFEELGSDYILPGGTLVETAYADWSSTDKQALEDAFDREWTWLYETDDRANNLGTDEFTMPLACVNCAANFISVPNDIALTVISETTTKTVYFAQVAHALAVEIGSSVEWSILTEDSATLHNYLNSRAIMYRYGANFVAGQPNFEVNAREKYLGEASPATPRFVFAWLESNDIIKDTRGATINAFLEWARSNLFHYYGGTTYSNTNDHWLFPGKPSIDSVLLGTTSTSYGFGHWTAGCHGTAGLVKSVMRAVNIPVQAIYTCGHAQIYFPSEGRYLDHGDNPYNSNVTSSPRPVSDLLLDEATYTGLFTATPDFLDPSDPACANIGQAAASF